MQYRFGDYTLDTENLALQIGGETQSIEPKVFDVLVLLVEGRGRLVSYDELIERVWDGRIVSDTAISSAVSAARTAVGDTGARQALIKTVPKRGFRFCAEVEVLQRTKTDGPTEAVIQQEIRVCTSRDGTRIAHAVSGQGYPLVKAGHWMTHLEHDWSNPVWRAHLQHLSKTFCLHRYDQRGNGLSDWTLENLDLDHFVDDLEAVVDASGLSRFALYGTSQSVPVAIAYACRHPDRISHLILHGGFVRGRLVRGDEAERAQGDAIVTLMRHGWGKPGSPFIKAFSSMYIPSGTSQQIDAMVETQRLTTLPEIAVALRIAVDHFDVSDLLAEVAVPTLIVHARNDGIQSLDQGRALAAGIKGARLAVVESDNHVLLPQETGFDQALASIGEFVLAGVR